jgi:hypothetical protein
MMTYSLTSMDNVNLVRYMSMSDLPYRFSRSIVGTLVFVLFGTWSDTLLSVLDNLKIMMDRLRIQENNEDARR